MDQDSFMKRWLCRAYIEEIWIQSKLSNRNKNIFCEQGYPSGGDFIGHACMHQWSATFYQQERVSVSDNGTKFVRRERTERGPYCFHLSH